MDKQLYRFSVPSGIGDISWLLSKFINIPEVKSGEKGLEILVADGWPYRAKPFLNLVSQVDLHDYGPHCYEDIVRMEHVQEINHDSLTWEELKKRGYGNYFIQNNNFLERGKRLEDWLPDLECSFHYDLKLNEKNEAVANKLLGNKRRPLVGIFGSSKRGVKLWKGWMAEEWTAFIKLIHEAFDPEFVLLGAQWDHEIMDEIECEVDQVGIPYTNIVGKTTVGDLVAVLKKLDYYCGFSSGINVLATIVKTPCCAMWPEHQEALRYSWAPPELLEDGRYKAFTWTEPTTIFKSIKKQLEKHISWR